LNSELHVLVASPAVNLIVFSQRERVFHPARNLADSFAERIFTARDCHWFSTVLNVIDYSQLAKIV
jgi:hypothetical protein